MLCKIFTKFSMLNICRVKVSSSACGVFVYYFNLRPKYVIRLLLLLLCVIHCDVTQFYLNRLVNNFLIILPEENFRTRIFLFSDI